MSTDNQQNFDNLAFTKDSQLELTNGNASTSTSDKRKQKNKEKCMLFFLILFFLAIIALIVAVVVVAKKDDKDTETEVCLTPGCAMAAARIIENLDTSIEPCDDFYQFACNGWKRKNIIPEDRSEQTVFSLLVDEVDTINKYLLEDEEQYKDIEAIQKAKDMYKACVDMDRINEKQTSVAIPLLEEFGGWPVLSSNPGGNWSESDFNLTQLLISLRKYNNGPLINMFVSPDEKNTENRIIYIDQPGLGLPGRSYYLESNLEHMKEAYVKLAWSVAELFGADQTMAEADMREMLQMETDIANISMPPEDRRDSELLYNKMTISELINNFTEPGPTDQIQFDWFAYLSGIMSAEEVNLSLDHTEQVVVRAIPYYQKLFGVLQKYSKKTITNYVVWYIMKNRAGNLDSRFLDLVMDYNKVVSGVQTSRARWMSCTHSVATWMGMAVGHMFIKETFDESSKSVALEMIGNLRTAFRELLDEIDWMDSETKESAREKMEAMNSWIGYPSDIIEPETINELYENVTVDSTEYFENTLNTLKMAAVGGLKNLREKYDKNVWTTPPSRVNAYYNYYLNNIMFPAGIFQPPFYSKDQPKSLNYGAIGMVIGHEITHGFDDRGRQYDKDGNLLAWWKPEIIENFKQKAQCIIDQYDKFFVPEVNLTINGINTQGENIADNGGLKQSYRAYRRWVESQGKEEPLLPGLNYNNNQLFFINFAQLWCNSRRDEALISSIKNGLHSLGEFRVIGTLQNSKDFSQAFSCSNDKYMNPSNKCSVW
ncbi:Membrane metallo-endopeptidase-like 1 [Mactra antiquata]